MGKKGKRNRAVSTKQKGTRNVEGGVSETSGIEHPMPRGATSSITTNSRDIKESLSKLLNINDYEGVLKLESDAVSEAKALEGTEPQKASYIYLVIVNALQETELSTKEAREKAMHYLEQCWKAIHSLEFIIFTAPNQFSHRIPFRLSLI